MKKHTANWLKGRGLTGHEAFIPCEICGKSHATQVHHVTPRGMGGSKLLDGYENLIGCCFQCHRLCEEKKIPLDYQKRIIENRA